MLAVVAGLTSSHRAHTRRCRGFNSTGERPEDWLVKWRFEPAIPLLLS